MDLIERLENTMDTLLKVGDNYVEASNRFARAEEAFKIVRAKVFNLDIVQKQPNQVLRESEADVILQNDERFKPLYDEYLNAKMKSKEAWIMYEVAKEINESLRCLVNNLTFMKGGVNNG